MTSTKSQVLQATAQRQDITIGVLIKVDAKGAHVDFPDNPAGTPVIARSTVALHASDADREVALMFEFGDCSRPLILGLIQAPTERGNTSSQTRLSSSRITASSIIFEAAQEIVLKTRNAKLVLKDNGDIEIQGARITSRARSLQKFLAPLLKLN